MARKQGKAIAGGAPLTSSLRTRMEFAGDSSGYLDPTLQPLPEPSLKRWFSDEAAVQNFSRPVKPRI